MDTEAGEWQARPSSAFLMLPLAGHVAAVPFHLRYATPSSDGQRRVPRPAPRVTAAFACSGPAGTALCGQARRLLTTCGRTAIACGVVMADAIPPALWRTVPLDATPAALWVPTGDARMATRVQAATSMLLVGGAVALLALLWHTRSVCESEADHDAAAAKGD